MDCESPAGPASPQNIFHHKQDYQVNIGIAMMAWSSSDDFTTTGAKVYRYKLRKINISLLHFTPRQQPNYLRQIVTLHKLLAHVPCEERGPSNSCDGCTAVCLMDSSVLCKFIWSSIEEALSLWRLLVSW